MTKVLFMHHSTGANLIKEGDLRKHLKSLNPKIELWDHSYNLDNKSPLFISRLRYRTGLSDASGIMTGEDFDYYISNNSPKEYAEIFNRDSSDYTLSNILDFDIILFKNCYPTSNISSKGQLEEYKRYYKQIRDSLAKYKNKLFILITQPPLRANLTTKANAKRAKDLVNWLASKEFMTSKNLKVFNFFDLLADSNSYLKREYCKFIPLDGHPNKKANKNVARLLAEFINNSALTFEFE